MKILSPIRHGGIRHNGLCRHCGAPLVWGRCVTNHREERARHGLAAAPPKSAIHGAGGTAWPPVAAPKPDLPGFAVELAFSAPPDAATEARLLASIFGKNVGGE